MTRSIQAAAKPGWRRPHQVLLTLVALAALSACGGGEDTARVTTVASAGAISFASSIAGQTTAAAPEERKSRLAATAVNGVDANLLLDWAEFKFADLFPKARVKKYPLVYQGKTYSVREYLSGTVTRYLGVTEAGEIYGLGDFTNNALQSYGLLADWAAQVLVDRCGLNSTLCNNPAPAGPLNACTMPAAQFLAAGTRLNATFVVVGDTGSEIVTESIVEGAATFEGQAGTKVKSTSRTSGGAGLPGLPSISISTDTNTYFQAGTGGLTRTLGLDGTTLSGAIVINGQTISPGTTSAIKTVFNPVDINLEFTLAQGQTLTKYTTASNTVAGLTVTVIAGITYTFEAMETITVQGKSYATCRYLESAQDSIGGADTVWYIQGRGVPARTTSVSTSPQGGSQTITIELKSGSFNGQPL